MLILQLLLLALSPQGDLSTLNEWQDPSDALTFNELFSEQYTDGGETGIEPGELPEGDYLYDICYTPDGSGIILTNYMTCNLSVVDPSTGTVVQDIPTQGMRPGAVACCDNYIVATFPFDNKASVMDADGNLLGTVETGEQPWVTELSPDGETAYVSCDIDDCVNVIDLSEQTVTATIQNFPVWLQSYGYGSENPRFYVKFSRFTVTPDGEYLAVANGEDAVEFYSTSSGDLEHTIAADSPVSLELSGNGETLTALCTTSDVTLHRIDLSSLSITGTVTVTGSSSGMAKEIAVNQSGSKAFISTGGNTSTLVNFDTGTWKQFTNTYSAFWTGSNHDHTLAISGQYRFSVIDFATEEMVGQHQGNSQYFGATSPTVNQAAGFDPMRHEGLYLYSFNGSSVSFDGTVTSGSPVEADAPRRVAISPDGKWAVVTSVLSDNASLIDLSLNETVAVLEMGDRVQNVEFTPDSRYAVVACFNSNSVKLIDTDTASVAVEVPAGTRAGNIAISPDGSMACVANISANTVSFIELNGASSTEVAEVPCGTIGVSWACYGVQSGLCISPDGSLLLVCDSFNDNVLLFDMTTYGQIASVPVGDFPLRAAFNHDGSRAMVTCYSADRVYLLEIDGASSSVLDHQAAGDGPLRITYDQSGDRFGVGIYGSSQIRFYDAGTGALQGTENYSGAVWQPMFTGEGEPMALVGSTTSTAARLYRGSDFIELPGNGCTFDYCPESNKAVVAIPGPDMAYVVDYDPQGAEGSEVSLSSCITVSPNPVSGSASLSFSLPRPVTASLMVYDMSGRSVFTAAEGSFTAGMNTTGISLPEAVPSGVYSVRLSSGEISISGRLAVVR